MWKAKCVDLESVKTMYKKIFELFIGCFARRKHWSRQELPHKKDELKLQTLSSKLKIFRLKFCQAKVGVNLLKKILPHILSKEAGVGLGVLYTNHSLQAMAITRGEVI